ncbi:MAG: glycosyltransferase family 4 protein [Desulfobacterales bacterium]|nr:glycosyltransferase family 4 protein [Desulfobacterales bacterium]
MVKKKLTLYPFLEIKIQKKRIMHIITRLDMGGSAQIGFAGWLLPIKGPMYLLKAMPQVLEKCPDTELVYVGKGDMKEQLQVQAKILGISDKVKFLGWRNDIHEIMPVLDVFALPSLNEGMGRVLVEAMAAGKPVVASRTGGIPDLVRHGETGMLVPRQMKMRWHWQQYACSQTQEKLVRWVTAEKYCVNSTASCPC